MMNCSICMKNQYEENIAKQHEIKHPAICLDCFEKLIFCPFCRVRIKPDRKISLNQKKITDFYLMSNVNENSLQCI